MKLRGSTLAAVIIFTLSLAMVLVPALTGIGQRADTTQNPAQDVPAEEYDANSPDETASDDNASASDASGSGRQDVQTQPAATPAPTATPAPPEPPKPTATPAPIIEMIVPIKDYKYLSATFSDTHHGADFASDKGAEIFAAADGTVSYAGNGYGTGGDDYGLCIAVDHGDGILTLYAHNSRNLVKEGDPVTRGQTIAYVGSTGNATGPHLHFEVRYNGENIDPSPYIGLDVAGSYVGP